MNNMMDTKGVIHGVPHDLMTCTTLCASGSVEALGLRETSRAINCEGCIEILSNPDINSQAPPNHLHIWQAPQFVRMLVDWYGLNQYDAIWSQISEWAQKGQNVAIYRNNDMSSHDCGHPRLFPHEGEVFGQRLPDLVNGVMQVNFRYGLEAVFMTNEHKTDLKPSDVIRPDELDEIRQKEAEQAAQAEQDIEDFPDEIDEDAEWPDGDEWDDDDDQDDYYEHNPDEDTSDGYGNVSPGRYERGEPQF